MAAPSRTDSKRRYSWWWDSHISPKNSKWLQENLTDMDVKVKQMIKLIEEDADSFARRAEMYYKKRPELMKLVEEFYRAYRALAERYDHATVELRQAHRTMAEAFPNQIPFVLCDDYSPSSFPADGDLPAHFELDEQLKDVFGISPLHANSPKRNGAFSDELDSATGRKGLKQLNDLFGSGDGVNHAKFAEGRARKGLNFIEAEENDQSLQDSGFLDIRARVPSESERMSIAELEILTLKNALSKLEAEKAVSLLQYQQNLERLSNIESEVSHAREDSKGFNERAGRAEAEVQSLKEGLAKLDAEREASLGKYQQCLDKISNLENSISIVQKEARDLDDRASKAEVESQSFKKTTARLEAEKEVAVAQYEQCLQKISDIEQKLLHAEEDSRRSNKRADDAERKVESLQQALTRLSEEKKAAADKYLQCLETIASLEHKLVCALEEVQRLKNEIDEGAVKLEGSEKKYSLLERSNQTMQFELQALAQKVVAQSEELAEMQNDMGRLRICMQEESGRLVEAETAFQTLQDLHSQSEEELKSTAAQLKNRIQALEDLDAHHRIIRHEIEEVKLENRSLTDVNLSSVLTIKDLQEEISVLRETIRKLETEVELHVGQRSSLQQEVCCLREELNDLNMKHQNVMGQVESVGFSLENFGTSVKDLHDNNIKLKEAHEKDQSEKIRLMEKLEILQKLIEKNALLENSLSDLSVELEAVREKGKTLEEYCEYLLEEKSTLVSEKAVMVSELQNATSNLEKLTEKNYFLENSLLDANSELEGLKVNLKNLEASCMLLEHEKSDLASMKVSLISQLDITQKRLGDLEKNYTDLEKKYLGSEKDKESMLHEIEELRVCLDAGKQEQASLAQCSKIQMAGMESQIHQLQEEAICRKKEYEEELDKAVNADVEIFILQESMQDLAERSFSFLLKHQKLLEASKQSEKLISELKYRNLQQQTELKSLLVHINSLRGGLSKVLKPLELDANQGEFKAENDQALLNHVISKIQDTQKFLLKMQDENQELMIDNSVLVTLLGQLQQEVANLISAKSILDNELRTRSQNFMTLKCESQKLEEMNEELRLKIMDGDHREKILKGELTNLHGRLSDLVCTYQNIQLENCKVLDEVRSLSDSVSDLREENCNLEYKNCAIFGEAVSQSTISLVLEAAMKQIEEMKSSSYLHREGFESGKSVKEKQEGKELGDTPTDDPRLHIQTHEISEGSEMITKDIMLDQISECSSYEVSRRETAEADDRMLELWGTTGKNGSIDLTVERTGRIIATSSEKKQKEAQASPELLVEKEVSVDTLEISKRHSREGNGRKILERLDSDARKLTKLQITVQDLKKIVETTNKSKKVKSVEYDSVKEQLEESEEAIIKLFDLNRRLVKGVEDTSVSSDEEYALTPEDSATIQRRKITEQARRASEKIGRLQLELQKLQYLLQKLDDGDKSKGKTKTTEQNMRVLLRDYLYGKKRTSQKRKKHHFCSCVRPPVSSD